MKTYSLLRRAEYKVLEKLILEGSVLDIGGSKKSGYHEILRGTHMITTANIDASYGADLIFDAQERWPCEAGVYDAVLFINVLEHLYKPLYALTESARALKYGGQVVGVVPFMFNVHGSPSDYFRYTKFALQEMLTEAGFENIQIQELGTGVFSLIYQSLFSWISIGAIASVLIPVFTGLDMILKWIRPHNKLTAEYVPLGYYFTAVRK